MKRSIIYVIACVFAAVLVAVVAYKIGADRQKVQDKDLIKGECDLAFDALHNIRTGSTQSGLEQLERIFYGRSAQLIGNDQNNTASIRLLVDKVSSYRKAYAAPAENWTPTERILDELIQKHQ